MPARAVNLPFVFWKTRTAGGYLIVSVAPGKAHSCYLFLSLKVFQSRSGAAGGEYPLPAHIHKQQASGTRALLWLTQ